MNYGHVVMGKTSPLLLYQIGARETRLLIDVPTGLPAASSMNGGVHGYIKKAVLPSLPASVQVSLRAALADGKTPRSMPNLWLSPISQTKHRSVVNFGDAMNMRHPLGGGGMTVALNDVDLLAELLAPALLPNLGDTVAVRRAMSELHHRRKPPANSMNLVAHAIYCIFTSSDRHMRALQRGVFAYFQGGFTDEPVGLLGGIVSEPFVLAYHFFFVILSAVQLHANDVCDSSFTLLKLPLVLLDGVMILYKVCIVFVPLAIREIS